MSEVYQPDEDSYLLQSVTKKLNVTKKEKILDMGAGTGIQGEVFIEKGIPPKNVTFVDINSQAINYLKKHFPKSKIIKSNLFAKVKGKFNIIVFNPPYLPEDKREPKPSRIATTGGKVGGELINKFLVQAKKHLTKKGKILLLVSSLTKGINLKGYNKKLLAKKKLFFEELKVILLR